MPQLILFNKPFNVLSQFTGAAAEETLAYYLKAPGFYPAGRLDKDSEGLLLLTDCGETQQRISNPRHKLGKLYWSQVEGSITDSALQQLRRGDVRELDELMSKLHELPNPQKGNLIQNLQPFRRASSLGKG